MSTFICYKGKVKDLSHIPQQYRGKTLYVCKEPIPSGTMLIETVPPIQGHKVISFSPHRSHLYYDTPYYDTNGCRHTVPKEDIEVDNDKEYTVNKLSEDFMTMVGM